MQLPKDCNSCGYYNDIRCLHDDADGVTVGDGTELPSFCPIKEDVLDSVRFRVHYRDTHFYLVVAEREGAPWEVFVDHATNSEHSLQFMLSGWDTATRFVTISLKCKGLDYTICQLQKSSRQKNDLPGIIADKLKRWVK